jgi:hypothetical protein
MIDLIFATQQCGVRFCNVIGRAASDILQRKLSISFSTSRPMTSGCFHSRRLAGVRRFSSVTHLLRILPVGCPGKTRDKRGRLFRLSILAIDHVGRPSGK